MINLDAKTPENLMIFCKNHASGRAYRDIFPRGGKGTKKAVADLANYAANKAVAILCRERGDTRASMRYEAICETIYIGLPEFAKWGTS